MEIALPKCTKQRKMETGSRSWLAKPILGTDYTEDPPVRDVYVGILKSKKDISTSIQSVSAILPGFGHLKRCSGSRLLLAAVDSSDSSFILEESSVKDNSGRLSQEELKILLKDKGFDLSLLEEDFQVLKVPSKASKTKVQAARASKIWPVNFHPDPNVERLIDGSIFTEFQLDCIESYMNVAIEAAKLDAVGSSNCTGSALIVDPEDGRILAIAASRMDQHPMWHAAMLAIDLVARLQGGGAWELNEENQNIPHEEESLKDLEFSRNSLEEKLESTCQDDNKSYADRAKKIKRKYVEEAPLCYPKSLSKIPLPKEQALNLNVIRKGRRNNGAKTATDPENFEVKVEEKCGPYLCTGYWTFLPIEPCPLCAMALLHSRVSRIFYGTCNRNTGVLGTKAILHAVPGLNHRYQVWSGILEEECERLLNEINEKTSVISEA